MKRLSFFAPLLAAAALWACEPTYGPADAIGVNGPEHTFIEGAGPDGTNAVRCVYISGGALLAGFTLTNGHTLVSAFSHDGMSGGGVLPAADRELAKECVGRYTEMLLLMVTG